MIPPVPAPCHWLTAERIRVYSLLTIVIFAVAFVSLLALSLPDLVDPRGKPFGFDFMAFWSAARLALTGQPTAVFDPAAISAVQHAAVPIRPEIYFPWHYPPTYLLAVLPLGLLPYPGALAAFLIVSCTLWAAFVRRLLSDPRAWLAAAATPTGMFNLFDGQNAFLTAALAGFALLWIDRRPIVAGILIGLLAIKPHLAVLFPVALVAGGLWRSFVAAAVTLAAFLAASIFVLGDATLLAFADHLAISQGMADRGAVPWAQMPSPYVLMLSLRASPMAAAAVQAAAALAAAVCVWRSWRSDGASFEAKSATLLAASLLVSPYLFTYDFTWAAVAIGFLAILGIREGFGRGERNALVVAWLAPLAFVPVYTLLGAQFGCLVPALLLAVSVRRASAAPSSSPS